MTKLIHFTTVHPRTDARIRVKEVRTLSETFDIDIALYVQDGLEDETDETGMFRISSTGPRIARQRHRILRGNWRMFRAVRRAKPKVAHFHDPELILVGLLLKLNGIKIVYDVHEDVPKQVGGNPRNSSVFRRVMPPVAMAFEWIADRVFDGVVPATPAIAEKFSAKNQALVQNFPLLAELQVADAPHRSEGAPHFAYVGGITRIRGAVEMVGALERMNDPAVRLQMAGKFTPELGELLESLPGWSRVDFHGWSDRAGVARILSRCRAGLVVLHPTPQYVTSYPVKMFEYMAAGLPVIASDFRLWREIVEGAGCGLLVDPRDPDAIAGAMQWILDNPEEAAAMGRHGRAAVEERYNWEAEGEKLVALYRRLLSDT